MDSEYKVCILAAGVGSRMGDFSKTSNKVLIPVNGKPTLGHIIEKFPEGIPIVIAVGYLKETIIDFVKNNYQNRNITFVNVNPFSGTGSGPGYSLLQCKPYLQCPFIQFAGDTLVKENIPIPDENWFGVVEVKNTERFLSVKVSNKEIVRMDDKTKNDNKHAFIGLAGVKDYGHFWDSLENNKHTISGEIQVSNGFSSLIEKGMKITNFTWFDTGTPESYKHACINYPNGHGYNGE